MRVFLFSIYLLFGVNLFAQERVFPFISEYGGIYEIPRATVTADDEIDYKVVIDLLSGANDRSALNPALNNVARLLNLHAVAGADMERVKVVLAVHGGATPDLVTDDAYNLLYGMDNPNTGLIDALSAAGVEITVCGQSLLAREVPINSLNPNVTVATSMLTTVTTLQMQGYALLKF